VDYSERRSAFSTISRVESWSQTQQLIGVDTSFAEVYVTAAAWEKVWLVHPCTWLTSPLLLATAARLVGAHSNLLITVCGLVCIPPNIEMTQMRIVGALRVQRNPEEI
jgi:hypothetical protein